VHRAASNLKIVRARFERFAGQRLEIFGKFLCRAVKRGTAARDRARAAGANASGDATSIR
jgi:hypothetical protein